MRAIISRAILPLPIFWVLVIIAWILYWRRKKKLSKIFGITALLWLLIVSTPFIPNLLVSGLENKYPPLTSLNSKPSTLNNFHILVLGAGHTNDSAFPATSKLNEEALARLSEGIRLHQALPKSKIITSGYKGKGAVAQAEVLARAAEMLGVESNNILTQTEPENTLMEALEYKRNFGEETQLILVTSAIHMPRSIYLFCKAGLKPIPAPANFITSKNEKKKFWFWLPNSRNIKKMEAAIHEYVGILWYRIGGK